MRTGSKAQEDGATAVEYALMLTLVFLAIVTSVGLLGQSLFRLFANAAALI